MCGIAGILSNHLSFETRTNSLQSMIKALKHRGPDGQNYFADGPCNFGHARLSVIDVSSNGSQPMTRNGVTLVYNGELYNFQEKRQELLKEGFVFKGTSDAEVLLALYLKWGISCLSHLRGMYAFSIWDSRSKTLYCARDPLGIKPFLYSYNSEKFIFASEIRALIASKLISKEINRQSIRTLLERGSISQPESILKDVKWLLPGHLLTIQENKKPKIESFYKFAPAPLNLAKASFEELCHLGSQAIKDSLHRQMVADVPLGAFLSGGIDSSLLVALMAKEHPDLRTFSVGFMGNYSKSYYDETAEADVVARFLGVKHTKIVIEEAEVLNQIQNIAASLDHPTVDGINTWFVSRSARKDLTVAISGTGGDELFAGYPWFQSMVDWGNADFLRKIKRNLKGESFLDAFNNQYRIFPSQLANDLVSGTGILLTRHDPLENSSVLNRVTGLVLSGYTRDQLLADVDTASMAHGLEVRVPFLDEKFLEFALALPAHAKIGLPDTNAPQESYAATGVKRILLEIGKPLLPPGFDRRSKRGFSLPFDLWLNGALKPIMKEMLSQEVVKNRGFFDPASVDKVQRSFNEGKTHWSQPWLLMTTELWAQGVLDE